MLTAGRCLSFVVLVSSTASLCAADSTGLIEHCHLSAIKEVNLPATDVGMLVEILVEEGDVFEADQLLAQIDDREAQWTKQVAFHQYRAAKKQAENQISVEAAIKSRDVARAEYDSVLESNKRVPGSFPINDVRRLELSWERARLQIQLAEFENAVAALDARAKLAQYEQADAMISRRRLVAPFAGEVMFIPLSEGDWVNAGDPVMQIIQMDQLRVIGRVNADHYHWRDVVGRRVAITVHMPGQRNPETVAGQIGFASSVIEEGGTFRVWADIANRRENVPGQPDASVWLFGPGMKATMQLK